MTQKTRTTTITSGTISNISTSRNSSTDVEHERVVERLRLMRSVRRNLQDLSLAHRHFGAVDQRAQRTLEDVDHLLARVRVGRHERALLEVRLHERLLGAGDHLAGDH